VFYCRGNGNELEKSEPYRRSNHLKSRGCDPLDRREVVVREYKFLDCSRSVHLHAAAYVQRCEEAYFMDGSKSVDCHSDYYCAGEFCRHEQKEVKTIRRESVYGWCKTHKINFVKEKRSETTIQKESGLLELPAELKKNGECEKCRKGQVFCNIL